MFTGLVEKLGYVIQICRGGSFIEINAEEYPFRDGDSIAVNGCCLTARDVGRGLIRFDLSPETLSRTNLGNLSAGSYVNLERALRIGDRLGGHLVSGHVDTTAIVTSLVIEGNATALVIVVDAVFSQLIVPKGSICLDGVSLTINTVHNTPTEFGSQGVLIGLMLIPRTLEGTTFKNLAVGQKLNVEFDMVGKFLLNTVKSRL